MLLSYNNLNVVKLVNDVERLSNIDKLRLSIYILENKSFNVDYDVDSIIILLKDILSKLDSNYTKVIVNFAKYKNLLLISSKYLELNLNDKKRFTVELLFNIYESDFNDKYINELINNKLNVYDYSYSLKIV